MGGNPGSYLYLGPLGGGTKKITPEPGYNYCLRCSSPLSPATCERRDSSPRLGSLFKGIPGLRRISIGFPTFLCTSRVMCGTYNAR